MAKITATEARALAGMTIEEIVDLVFDQIRIAATAKQRKLKLYGDFWADEGYLCTQKYLDATRILKDAGFQVEYSFDSYREPRCTKTRYTVVKW